MQFAIGNNDWNRYKKKISQTSNRRPIDLERSGSLGQCEQIQGHTKSYRQ